MEWHEGTAYEKIRSYWRLIQMSKERLKEIEERVLIDKVYYKYLDGKGGYWGNIYTLSEEDYNYLKEQAERVQELENENRILKTVAEINKYIGEQYLEQNKRYREALEFYADDKSWEFDWLDDIRESLIWQDYGEKARKALEG